jgi:uncharacterized protein YjbI with pentapeptide repeats
MSNMEHVGANLPVGFELGLNTSQELSGMPVFDLETFLERQGIIDDIFGRGYASDETRTADLNSHIAGWDDDKGISYTYIVGRHLPGLQVHVPAIALAFAANYAPEANFEGANLDYAVMSASVMPGVKLRRSSLDHALMPLVIMAGDARGVSAVKAVMNFADVTNLDMSGVDVGAGYLLGMRGLDEEKLLSLSDSQEAISELAYADRDPLITSLLGDGLSRFSGQSAKDIIRRLRYPQVFSNVNTSEVILRKQLRDRRQGMVLDNVYMNGSEISKYDFEGNVWHEVMADRAHAVATRMAGAVLLNSSLGFVESRGAYAPGLVAVNSSFRGTPLPKNSAGSVYFNCDLTGASVEEVQEGGMVIIGGKPPEIEKDLPHIRVLSAEQLPRPVIDNLLRHAQTTVQTTRLSMPYTPELEAKK